MVVSFDEKTDIIRGEMMLDSVKGMFLLSRSIFLIENIILLYIFLEPKKSRCFQIVVYISAWITISLFRLLLYSFNFDPLLISYILGSLYLVPVILIFKETIQAKIFVFYLIYSLTQLTYLIFTYIDYFFTPAVPKSFVLAGLMLELAALPFIKRYMKLPVKDIIEIIDQHNTSFILFPIVSFLLLTCYAFQRTFLLFSFITLILSTILIFYSYYLIANSISGTRRHQELERISMTDSLTGLYNRRYIEQKIQHEYNLYKKTGSGFALASADIDFFKKINDLYGHDCGDFLLKSITEDIRKSVRIYDTVARWGGEEFLLLLPATNREQAVALAERIRKTVEEGRYEFDGGNKSAAVTLTIGVSVVSSGDTIEGVIKKADIALYYGKRKSRNCVTSFDEIKKESDL